MTGTRRSRGGHVLAGPSAPAVALLRDRVAQARVLDVLKAYSGVVFVDTAREMLDHVADGPIGLVIVECRDREGASTLPTVQSIRRGYPSVSIIAYTSPGQTPSSEILAMAHAGVHELIIQGFDDVGTTLRAVVESALRRCAATRVMQALERDLPPELMLFVEFCLERAWVKTTVSDAARYLGVHPKTLVHRLRRSVRLAPSALIGWCRLFVAAHMLEDPNRSVAQIALALDFASSAALRGMLRRYTGLRPQEVRERGGLELVVAMFRRQLRGGKGVRGIVSDAPAIADAPPLVMR